LPFCSFALCERARLSSAEAWLADAGVIYRSEDPLFDPLVRSDLDSLAACLSEIQPTALTALVGFGKVHGAFDIIRREQARFDR
jgi:hypothetical protein